MVKREKENYVILSVSHALDVLDALTEAGKEIGVTELAQKLGLQKNNIFRILATLELRGYVEQNPDTEAYSLGVKSLQLGQSYLAQSDIILRSLPFMKNLSQNINETVSFAVLQNTRIQYPVSIASQRSVKVSSRYGVSFNAKDIPAGRLILSSFPESTIDEMYPTDTSLKRKLDELRSSDTVINKDFDDDVITICKLVSNHRGVVGAIEVMVPKYRANIDDILPQINQTATSLSKVLGINASFKPKLQASIEKEQSAITSSSKSI